MILSVIIIKYSNIFAYLFPIRIQSMEQLNYDNTVSLEELKNTTRFKST